MRVAIDTSSWVAYLNGEQGNDVELVEQLLESNQVLMPPVVLSELLSDPKLPTEVERLLVRVPMLEIKEDYWLRAGKLRAAVLKKRHRVHLADALIATNCLDHRVTLLTRDRDFRHFARHAKLKLL